jgi:hypothetical protein
MSDNIIPIHGNHVPGQPVADIVDMLADMLIRAQKGDITALAVVEYNSASDVTATHWSGIGGTRHPLGTGIAMLQHRYIAGMLECGCKRS